MKSKEINKLTKDELENKYNKLKKDLFNMRFKKLMDNLKTHQNIHY